MSITIIAEAGVNHNGSLELAKRLALEAKEAGADIVKYQTFVPENLVSRRAEKAEYQKAATGEGSQLSMLQKLSLSKEDFMELHSYCKEIGICFLSTPFDLESIDFLDSLQMPMWKIPSGEITNLPYLIKIANTGKPVILSTGMSTMGEVKDAVNILKENGTSEITLLHCTTEYPAPYKDVNLLAMKLMWDELGLPMGYSDHTPGIEISIAAAAVGAVVIEKHFTLDNNMKGPDHKASLSPDELKEMIRCIRNVEISLGSGNKIPMESERKNMPIARKSIVAKKSIRKGEIFTEDNLTVKRPGNGISPMKWFDVLGQAAARDFEEDELIYL